MTQVMDMSPVVEVWRKPTGLVNPEVTREYASTTGDLGAGGLASLVRGELNPDSPYNRTQSNNAWSLVASGLVLLPPRSRGVVMGRIVRHSDNMKLPQAILIEPVPINNPGVYVARAVSEVYKRNGLGFVTMRGLPQGEVEREIIGSVVDVTTSLDEAVQAGTQRAQRDKENVENSDPRYCLMEIINTSVDTVEIGKNVKLGDGETP
jgi:hypothetical protein